MENFGENIALILFLLASLTGIIGWGTHYVVKRRRQKNHISEEQKNISKDTAGSNHTESRGHGRPKPLQIEKTEPTAKTEPLPEPPAPPAAPPAAPKAKEETPPDPDLPPCDDIIPDSDNCNAVDATPENEITPDPLQNR